VSALGDKLRALADEADASELAVVPSPAPTDTVADEQPAVTETQVEPQPDGSPASVEGSSPSEESSSTVTPSEGDGDAAPEAAPEDAPALRPDGSPIL
jgi:hypothetical protein